MEPITIQILHVAGCAGAPLAAAEARAAAAELDVPVRVSVTLVNDAATAVALGLRGSPTVTVDGVDVEEATAIPAGTFG